MADKRKPEVWLRGPLDNIPPLLHPVAHALLQAREEINEMMASFPGKLLWEKPVGMASPGFHLQHLTGVLNRLFTYARGQQLTQAQLAYLSNEGKATASLPELIDAFNKQVGVAIVQLSQTDESTLTQTRGVGRAMVPSTILGLLFHSAEHTMRHTGQLLVTVKFLVQAE